MKQLFCIVVFLVGCAHNVQLDRDCESVEAVRIVPAAWHQDNIDGKTDPVDWKELRVPGKGLLTIEVVFRNKDAAASVSLHEIFPGTRNLVRVWEQGKLPGMLFGLRFRLAVKGEIRYFLRIAAGGRGETSAYAVRWHLDARSPNTPPPW